MCRCEKKFLSLKNFPLPTTNNHNPLKTIKVDEAQENPLSYWKIHIYESEWERGTMKFTGIHKNNCITRMSIVIVVVRRKKKAIRKRNFSTIWNKSMNFMLCTISKSRVQGHSIHIAKILISQICQKKRFKKTNFNFQPSIYGATPFVYRTMMIGRMLVWGFALD